MTQPRRDIFEEDRRSRELPPRSLPTTAIDLSIFSCSPPSLSPLHGRPLPLPGCNVAPLVMAGMFVSPKSSRWNPNTQCDGVRRRSGHEGRALVNGISTLRKEAPESHQASSAVKGHEEKSVTRRGLSLNLTDTVIPDRQLQTGGKQTNVRCL